MLGTDKSLIDVDLHLLQPPVITRALGLGPSQLPASLECLSLSPLAFPNTTNTHRGREREKLWKEKKGIVREEAKMEEMERDLKGKLQL